MGAMVQGLYWGLAPSIKPLIVHALKSSMDGLYELMELRSIVAVVAGAGIPLIEVPMKELFAQATALGCTPSYRLMMSVRIWPNRIPRRCVSIPNRW